MWLYSNSEDLRQVLMLGFEGPLGYGAKREKTYPWNEPKAYKLVDEIFGKKKRMSSNIVFHELQQLAIQGKFPLNLCRRVAYAITCFELSERDFKQHGMANKMADYWEDSINDMPW